MAVFIFLWFKNNFQLTKTATIFKLVHAYTATLKLESNFSMHHLRPFDIFCKKICKRKNLKTYFYSSSRPSTCLACQTKLLLCEFVVNIDRMHCMHL